MSKCLVAPLNWGLGHASRCIPLIQRFLNEGHEVVLGGDGDSLVLLRKHFPKLRYVYLAPLNLRYSKGKRQVWTMLKALPQLFFWALKDHEILKAVLREEHFDQIISDNRFGLYPSNSPKDGLSAKRSISEAVYQPEAVYLTHQLHIMLPKGWRWLEPLAERLHARIYAHYNKVWIPDYEDINQSLAGKLSHPSTLNLQHSTSIEYIGPLSRFSLSGEAGLYDVVAVLSGLEPHRTLLEQSIIARYSNSPKDSLSGEAGHEVLIVQGLMNRPNTRIKRGNITIVPYMSDAELVPALLGAKHIIARSGYSTIMDLHALGLLSNSPKDGLSAERSISGAVYQRGGPLVELIPTPGQPEQEYLATWIAQKTLF